MKNTENTQAERKIVCYTTKGKKSVITTNVTTWGELQPLVNDAGYDLSKLHATESVNRGDLVNDNAILPATPFVLVMRPKKTKSGADAPTTFKEARAFVKENKTNEAFMSHINSDGVNYTRLKADRLCELIASWLGGTTTSVPAIPKAFKKAARKEKAPIATKKASKKEVAKEVKSTPAPKASVAEVASKASKVAVAAVVESVKDSKAPKSLMESIVAICTQAIASDEVDEDLTIDFEALLLKIEGKNAEAAELKAAAEGKAKESQEEDDDIAKALQNMGL